MHVHFLDPYVSRTSPVHALDPRVKFVLTLAFILTVSLTPAQAWPIYILLLSLILSIEILSNLGLRYVQKRAMLAFPFVLAAFPVIFTIPGTSLSSLSVGEWTLVASQEGLARFAGIALKSWISVQAAIVLTATTPFPDLLVAMRAVRTPRLMVAVFGLMWRYLFVLADEVLRLLRARSARSGELGIPGVKSGGSLAWRARVAGGMAGSLFLRAFERSDRIYMAMLSRGYDGEVRALPLPPLKSWHLLALGIGLILDILFLLAALLI